MFKAKSGKQTIEVSSTFEKEIEELIRRAAPEAIKIFEDSMEKIKAEARDEWPIRQKVRIMRNEKGEIVKRANGKSVVFKNPPSKRSIDKFKITTRIASGQIVVSLINTANYAYMIRMGIDSKGSKGDLFLPLGSRVWDKVVFAPVKKASKKVANDYADQLLKLQKD